MKALVTGSGGFIGGRLHDMLLGRSFTVVGVDKKGWHDLADILDAEDAITKSGAPFDIIFHLASSVSTPRSTTYPLETFRDTVQAGINVLEVARRNHIPVILTSSVKARDGYTPYGTSKRMVESWAIEYNRAYGTKTIINRPGTVYGPGQEGSPESGWIAWFLEAKRTGQKVTINGNGNQIRDLLYVDDYCELLITQALNPGGFGYEYKTWDVGGGKDNAVSVLAMAQHLGIEYEFGLPRYGDVPEYIGHNDVPGWKPHTHWRDTGMFG